MIDRLNCNAVDPQRLREAISYDAETGKMRWMVRPIWHFADAGKPAAARMAMWNGKYAGRAALTSRDPRGYYLGRFDGKNLWAHRAAWVLHYGQWPDAAIDHINRDKGDNRIANLRLTDHSANAINSRQSDGDGRSVARNASGSWRVVIRRCGQIVFTKSFATRSEAIDARNEAERLWDQGQVGSRHAANDMPGMLADPEEEARPLPVSDVQAGRSGLELLALRPSRGVLL